MAIADRPASETTGTDLPDLLARFVERASR